MFIRFFVLLCVFSVLVQCEIERRDVHRIVIKPERKKKNHYKSGKHSNRYHGHHRPSTKARYHSEELYSHESSKFKPHHVYDNHHEEYHELMNPRPPSVEDFPSYPEEEGPYNYQQASNVNYNREVIPDIWSPSATTFKDHVLPKPHNSFSHQPKLADTIDLTTSIPGTSPPIITAQPPLSQFSWFNYSPSQPSNYYFPTREPLIATTKEPDVTYHVNENVAEVRTLAPTSFHAMAPTIKATHFIPTRLRGTTREYGKRVKKAN